MHIVRLLAVRLGTVKVTSMFHHTDDKPTNWHLHWQHGYCERDFRHVHENTKGCV